MLTGDQLWLAASKILRSQVSDGVWQSTFSQAVPVELTSNHFVLGLPNGIVREKVDGRYRPLVEDAVTEAAGQDIAVAFKIALPTLFDPDAQFAPEPQPAKTSPSDGLAHRAEHVNQAGEALSSPLSPSHDQAPAGDLPNQLYPVERGGAEQPARPGHAPHQPNVGDQALRYTFETFVIGPSNRFAHAAALSVAERPGGSYNPLFIYGSAGLGKTHVLRAIEHFINDVYPRLKVLYVSTETFLNEFVDSIKNSSGNDFKRRYRQIDVLLVDDIQFIANKDSLQEELFHTFNDLYGSNRQIVLSSDRPPDAIPTLEERLKSRFMMGLLTDIQPPDIETRMAILHKKADNEKISLPNDVSEFIATNITSNIRELEGALNKVTAFANLNNEPMTQDVAERVLGDFIADRQPRPINTEMILNATVDQFGFPIEELIGKSRRRPLVIARQVAMYVTRELTDLSFPLIAREFGGRDHTTVMHACDKIGALMKERSQIYNDVMRLEKTVRTEAQSGK